MIPLICTPMVLAELLLCILSVLLQPIAQPLIAFAWFLYQSLLGMLVAAAIEKWQRNNHGLGKYERELSGYTFSGLCVLIFVIGALGGPSWIVWHFSVIRNAITMPNDSTLILTLWNLGGLYVAGLLSWGFHTVSVRSYNEIWDQIEPVSE
jgi:hypothetical protein